MIDYKSKYRGYCDYVGEYWSALSESDFEECGYYSEDDPQCVNCPYFKEIDQNGDE